MPDEEIIVDLKNIPEPDFNKGTVVFVLLCNKSAVGIYSTLEKAKAALDVFTFSEDIRLLQIKRFVIDHPAMIYLPY